MTKAKAIEVLNEAYDGFLIAEKVCSDAFKDEITDRKIALLTAIDALEQDLTVEAEPDNGWISVKDRMPDDKKRYLICTVSRRRVDIAYYQPTGDKYSNHEPFWQGSNCRFSTVTHWRPLPEPPESAEIMEAIAGSETPDRAERRPR